MKLVRINSGGIGLLVDLPAGPHVLDLAKSLGVFAPHDPVSGALLNGVLKEKSAWVAMVNNWQYLRMPLALLARTASTNPDDARLALYPLAHVRQSEKLRHGIVALDIIDAADLEVHDPNARLVMARQFAESPSESAERHAPSVGENVQVVDFSRRSDPRTRRE
jgi:hypothetical protein